MSSDDPTIPDEIGDTLCMLLSAASTQPNAAKPPGAPTDEELQAATDWVLEHSDD